MKVTKRLYFRVTLNEAKKKVFIIIIIEKYIYLLYCAAFSKANFGSVFSRESLNMNSQHMK